MIMGLIILGFGFVLIVLFLKINKKLDKKSDNTDDLKEKLDIERERKKDLSNLREEVVKVITKNYTEVKERISAVQTAQKDLGNLANQVIDFKNLFSNKTERGGLGEDYLEDIIRDAMSPKHYKFQHTFSNGKRVDCLLTLGPPEQCVSIDSKFSWENYKKMLETKEEQLKKNYAKDFAKDINDHIEAVSQYIIDGETAPTALMFVASNGVFRSIDKSPEDFQKKARAKNVVIVSPETIWGPLKAYRLLIHNKEMYRLSSFLQKEVGMLGEDVGRLIDRFSTLADRQEKVSDDFKKIKISMDKVSNRSEKIKNLDLEDVDKITKK